MPKYSSSSKGKSRKSLDWIKAPDIDKRVKQILHDLNLEWIDSKRIYCFRSRNSKARARARIWGLSRIFQQALDIKPAYVIEVISEKFDHLSEDEKTRILIHEIAHIPKTFSGSLLPHKRRGKFKFNDKVEGLFARYLKDKK